MAGKRGFDLLSGVEELPAESLWTESREGVVGTLGMAVALAGIAAFGVLHAGLEEGWPFLAVGGIGVLGMLALGLSRLLARREYRFTPERVQCSSRGLLGQDKWEEPISAYSGILRTVEHRYSREGTDYTLHKLVLKHSGNSSRDVTLYQSVTDRGIRDRHERSARLFALPALIETDEGWEERKPEDLDKSLRQRLAEGTVAVSFDARQRPPGRRLSLFVEGDTLRICCGGHPVVLILGATALLFGAATLVSGLLGVGVLQGIPTWVAIVVLAVAAALLAWFFAGREELLVSPSRVRRHHRWPGGTFGEQDVSADEVEEVLITSPTGQRNLKAVQVTSDSDEVSFGASLSSKQRRWVRDCIVAVISTPAEATDAAAGD